MKRLIDAEAYKKEYCSKECETFPCATHSGCLQMNLIDEQKTINPLKDVLDYLNKEYENESVLFNQSLKNKKVSDEIRHVAKMQELSNIGEYVKGLMKDYE